MQISKRLGRGLVTIRRQEDEAVAYDSDLNYKELAALLKESALNPNNYLIKNEQTALAALKK